MNKVINNNGCNHIIGQVLYVGRMKPTPIFINSDMNNMCKNKKDIVSKVFFQRCPICGEIIYKDIN